MAFMTLASFSSTAATAASCAATTPPEFSGLYPGLIGVILGGTIAITKDILINHLKAKSDLVYLSIMVGTKLDHYAQRCHAIAVDDGAPNDPWHRHPDENRTPQTIFPDFNPLDLKVEWETLPAQLLYDILNIPREASRIKASINLEYKICDNPPYHRDFFGTEENYGATWVCMSVKFMTDCVHMQA